MSGIKWEDPPDQKGVRPSVWVERLEPLMEHPERWANMGCWSRSAANALKKGRLKRPAGRWEFRAHLHEGQGSTRATLYARYLGPDEEPQP